MGFSARFKSAVEKIFVLHGIFACKLLL